MAARQRTVVVVVVAVVALAAVFVGVRAWQDANRTDLARALDVVPSDTLRLAFTDWSAVREALDIDPGDDPDKLADLISKGYDRDFTAVSSIDESAVGMQDKLGFSPASMDWEAFSQARDGAAMVARMSDGFDFDELRDKLDEAGFQRPKKDTGVWVGGTDLIAALDPTFTPELQFAVVLEDQHLIVTSDLKNYAVKAGKVARGDGKSLGDRQEVRDVVAPVAEPAAAMVWAGDFACDDLAMSTAADEDQDAADALVAKAGDVSPLSGLVMALGKDRSVTVSELFESASVAKSNLRPRAELAVGAAPGRGGSFSDDLKLTESRTDGATVQLRMEPRQKTGFLLSALDSGPVLFATC